MQKLTLFIAKRIFRFLAVTLNTLTTCLFKRGSVLNGHKLIFSIHYFREQNLCCNIMNSYQYNRSYGAIMREETILSSDDRQSFQTQRRETSGIWKCSNFWLNDKTYEAGEIIASISHSNRPEFGCGN